MEFDSPKPKQILEVLKDKESRTDYINIRIDKTTRAGMKSVKRICNENCVFDAKNNVVCHDDSFYLGQGVALENEQFVKLVERISGVSNKKATIHIAGDGEPTLLDGELVEFIRKMKESNSVSSVKLTTNGTLLASGKPSLASRLKQAGLDGVNVSIHSLSKSEFKNVTGINALDVALEGVEEALKVGLKVSVNCTVRERTFDELPDYIALSRSKGIKIKFFSLLTENLEVQKFYNQLVIKMYSQLEEIAGKSYSYTRPYAGALFTIDGALIEVKDSSINSCKNLTCLVRDKCLEGCRYHVRITRDGVMQPCGVRIDNIVNLTEKMTLDSEIFKSLESGGKI
ncbi:MAG: radical SAM protein [Candidatus Micrarchaeota archaeon]|nr:radical SAM protein [Candidatus Micrarchaeota archaeon]